MKTLLVPIIETDADLEEALARIEQLMQRGGDDADDEIRILGLLIHDYEREHVPFREPDAVETLEFVMSERGMNAADLVPLIGSDELVTSVLGRLEPLTAEMIQRLSDGLGIPAGALL